MKFFEFVSLHHYFEGLMIIVLLIAFIFSLRYYKRHRAFRIIPYYVAFLLLMEGVEFYRYISPPGDPFATALASTSAAILTVFEFWVFSLFILHYIAGPGRRLAVKLNTGIIFIAEIILYFRLLPRNPIVPMGVLETFGLVLPCALYFYEVFTDMNTKPLKDRPSFWVITGIISQSTFNAFLTISMEYMGRFGDGAYDFALLFYCILFVLIMRAYKCRSEEPAVA